MRLEFLNQKGTLDFDIQKKYPLVWTETKEGKHVDEFYINPVKGQIELSGDIIIDTGDLKIADVLHLAKAIRTLDKIGHKSAHEGICRTVV